MANPTQSCFITRRWIFDCNTLLLLLGGLCFWHQGATAETFSLPGRTPAQRADTCTKFTRDKDDWNNQNPNAYYSLQIKPTNTWGGKGCLVDSSDAYTLPQGYPAQKVYLREVCRQDDKLLKWTSANNKVNAHLSGTLTYLVVANDATTSTGRAVYAFNGSPFISIAAYYQPIWCQCGYDFTDAGICLDIDECQEKYDCPANSLCRNIDRDYECHCDVTKGYANQNTGMSLVEKVGGVCVLFSTRIQTSKVGPTGFDVSITGVTESNGTLLLYSFDENGAPAIDQQRKFPLTFTSSAQVRNVTFEGLNQGTRYKVMLHTSSTETWSDFIITKCYSEIIGTDDTGVPDSAETFQEEGYIMFKFIDNSLCEDAYSFARALLDASANVVSKEVFTPDYYFFSGTKTRQRYNPGRQATDDLRISKLQVGKQYAYQIRAASKQEWRVSNWATVFHTVRWQASVDGRVTLKPEAGLLPVEDVTVDYILEDLHGSRIALDCSLKSDDGWCRTISSSSGKFQIIFSLVHASLNNDDEFPVRMRFSKSTGQLAHQFLCNEGILDCTLLPNSTAANSTSNSTNIFNQTRITVPQYNSSVIHIRHLQFGETVNVIDDTAVPFRGKITVAGTEMPGAGVLGCPIVGAKVCINEHSTRNDIQVKDPVCVTTDGEGNYAIPAVVGTVISPKVNYFNHTFEPANPSHVETLRNGVRIESGVVYAGYNLKDVTRLQLLVEVAGGLCDRNLGKTKVLLTMQGCSWAGETLSHDAVSQNHDVIAQIVDLRIKSIQGSDGKDRNDIHAALSPSQDTSIDLREVENNKDANSSSSNKTNSVTNGNNTGATAVADAQQQETGRTKLNKVRFQYDGTDKITALFTGSIINSPGICGKNAKTENVNYYSYVVMPAYQAFQLIVYAEQIFGYDDIPTCTKYPEDTMMSIQNYVGVTDDIDDQEWIKKLEKEAGFEERVKLLRLCSPSCSMKLEMDASTGENAKVSLQLQAGQPSITGSYTKPLFITMEKSGVKQKTDVVLVGDYEVSDKFSAALPTHEPLLVIRDPPGGGSYSYYENVLTTVSVEMEQYEVFVGFDAEGTFGNGIEVEAGVCVGLGVAACTDLMKGGVTWEVTVGGGADFETRDEVEKSKAATFMTTWSYTTSADPWDAGTQSDVFLVPNLNVKFKEVKVVTWTNTTCAAAETQLKFALDSPENKPAIGFLSRFDVETVEITELTRLRDQSQVQMSSLNCTDTKKTGEDPKCEEYRSNRNAMNDAALDWQSFLDRHDNISKAAADGNLTKPKEWFSKIKKSFTDDGVDYVPDSHYSGLIPKDLSDGAVRLKNSINSKAKASDKSGELEAINLIKFDGGGSELNFQLTSEMVDDHTKKIGAPIDNSRGRQNAGGGVDIETAISTVKLLVQLSAMQHTETERHHTLTSTKGKETSIGFVLSDPDQGDVFDVQVFLDPRYGTFVFHTASGRSMCPHEEGTVYRELPKLMLSRQPKGLVLPDATLVFEVQLSNVGISSSSFVLFTDNKANTGLLSQLVNGDTLAAPQVYDDIGPQESIIATIAIKRGPVSYDYAPLPLKLASACEYAGGNLDGSSITLFNVVDSKLPMDGQNRIRFAEPCPSIHWAGDIAVDRSFRVNKADLQNSTPGYRLPIVLQNPEASYRSYQDVVSAPLGRLQDAGLWFRRVGASRWSRAYMRPAGATSSSPINFTQLSEDNYGYISAEWDLGSLADGDYELEARTICKSSPTIPASFNFATSERIQGTIDRREPRLFGLPTPSGNDQLYPGEAIQFVFTETILCSRPHVFEIVARVSTVPNRYFDNSVNDNLIVVCEDRSISIAFDPSNIDYAVLSNATVVVKVKGVEDLHGNPTDPSKPISLMLTVASSTLQTSSISFQVNLAEDSGHGPGRQLLSRALPSMAQVQEMVAQAAHVSVERVSVSPPGNSKIMPISEMTSYYVHIEALHGLHDDAGQNSLTAYHTLCRNVTSLDGDAIFSIQHPEIHFDPSEKRHADSVRRTLIASSNQNSDQEMKSLVLDATGDSVLFTRLDGIENAVRRNVDGTDMQLNEIANAVRQTDMRMNGIENAVRGSVDGTEERLNGIEVLLREELQRIRHLQHGTSNSHRYHGSMAVVTGALITVYMLSALL